MARKISLFILRKAAKTKNGSDTNVAVDASGSACFRPKYKAMITINNETNREIETSKTMGILSTPPLLSLFISSNVVSRETEEKHNR